MYDLFPEPRMAVTAAEQFHNDRQEMMYQPAFDADSKATSVSPLNGSVCLQHETNENTPHAEHHEDPQTTSDERDIEEGDAPSGHRSGRPVCKFWREGRCKKGAHCKFKHPGEQHSAGEGGIAQPASPAKGGIEALPAVYSDYAQPSQPGVLSQTTPASAPVLPSSAGQSPQLNPFGQSSRPEVPQARSTFGQPSQWTQAGSNAQTQTPKTSFGASVTEATSRFHQADEEDASSSNSAGVTKGKRRRRGKNSGKNGGAIEAWRQNQRQSAQTDKKQEQRKVTVRKPSGRKTVPKQLLQGNESRIQTAESKPRIAKVSWDMNANGEVVSAPGYKSTFAKKLSAADELRAFQDASAHERGTFRIFSDGSQKGIEGGSGSAWEDDDHQWHGIFVRHRLGGSGAAELYGAFIALQRAVMEITRGGNHGIVRVSLFTDSTETLELLAQPFNIELCTTQRAIVILVKQLLKAGIEVAARWVRSHNGCVGNELADRLAGIASGEAIDGHANFMGSEMPLNVDITSQDVVRVMARQLPFADPSAADEQGGVSSAPVDHGDLPPSPSMLSPTTQSSPTSAATLEESQQGAGRLLDNGPPVGDVAYPTSRDQTTLAQTGSMEESKQRIPQTQQHIQTSPAVSHVGRDPASKRLQTGATGAMEATQIKETKVEAVLGMHQPGSVEEYVGALPAAALKRTAGYAASFLATGVMEATQIAETEIVAEVMYQHGSVEEYVGASPATAARRTAGYAESFFAAAASSLAAAKYTERYAASLPAGAESTSTEGHAATSSAAGKRQYDEQNNEPTGKRVCMGDGIVQEDAVQQREAAHKHV